MSDPVISVQNVSKAYRIWESPGARLTAPMLEGAAGLLPGAPGQWLKSKASKSYRDFWALKDISFEVKKGESVGIIGRNGSGKSTLLQIIAGTLQPTDGSIKVTGRVAALLELGSGFNPEFTGRENIFLNAAVLGLARREIEAKFAEITAFADIGDFIEQPVKTYSSGMLMRVAFAVQTAVNPDILIVDEALSVGDFFFQQKCAARMRTLREQGTTVLFVSHDLASVRDLCPQALYLRQGKMKFWGESQEAIARYYGEGQAAGVVNPVATSAIQQVNKTPEDYIQSFRSLAQWWNEKQSKETDSNSVELLGVAFRDGTGRPSMKAMMGAEFVFFVLFRARLPGDYHVAIELKNRYDQVLNSSGSYPCGLNPQRLKAGQIASFEMSMQLNFEAGRYTCQIVLGQTTDQPNRGQRLAASPWLGPIEITWDYENERAPFLGMFGPPTRARFISKPQPSNLPAQNEA
jgi:lipopolysaccharide transport system ATP-binding protein